jgi:hypothetical protein
VASVDHRHVPPYLIDRLLVEVLPQEVAAAVGRQQQGCEVCRQRVEEAQQAHAEFIAQHPPDRCARELLARFDRARRRRRLAWTFPALSVVFGLFVLGRTRQPETVGGAAQPSFGPEPSIGFSVFRPGSPGSRPGQSGERLRAGDTVQLHLGVGHFTGAHVFSLDDQGRAEPLFDWSPSSGALPPSLVLDQTPESERIVVLFHDLPDPAVELPRLREAMASTYRGPGAPDPSVVSLRPRDGREIVTGSILIRKEPLASDAAPPDAQPDPPSARAF